MAYNMLASSVFNSSLGTTMLKNNMAYSAILSFLFIMNAEAATVTMESLSSSQYISSSTNSAGTISLADTSILTSGYKTQVTSGQVTFSFTDESDSSSLTYQGQTYNDRLISRPHTNTVKSGDRTTYYYNRYVQDEWNRTYTEESESAKILLGTQTSNAQSTTSTQSTNTFFTGYSYFKTTNVRTGDYCDNWFFGICTDRDDKYQHDTWYSRNRYFDTIRTDSDTFSITVDLSLANLAQLSNDFVHEDVGTLSYDISSLLGDFNLSSIKTTLNYSQVPEPNSLFMLMLGFLSFAFQRKRRSIQS